MAARRKAKTNPDTRTDGGGGAGSFALYTHLISPHQPLSLLNDHIHRPFLHVGRIPVFPQNPFHHAPQMGTSLFPDGPVDAGIGAHCVVRKRASDRVSDSLSDITSDVWPDTFPVSSDILSDTSAVVFGKVETNHVGHPVTTSLYFAMGVPAEQPT